MSRAIKKLLVALLGSVSMGTSVPAQNELILDYEVIEKSPQMLGFNVTYDYDIPPGEKIGLGVDALVNGKYMGLVEHQKVVMPSGKNTVQTRITYIETAPMRIETTELEFYLYLSGGSPFYRRRYPFKHQWRQEGVAATPTVSIQGTFTQGQPVPDFLYETKPGEKKSFRKLVEGKPTLLYAMGSGEGAFGDWVLPMLELWRKDLAAKGVQMVGIQSNTMDGEADYGPVKWKPFGPVIADPSGEFQLAFSAMVGIVSAEGVLLHKGSFTPLLAQQYFGVQRAATKVRPVQYSSDPTEPLKNLRQPPWWKDVHWPTSSSAPSLEDYGRHYRAPGVPNIRGRMILKNAFEEIQRSGNRWISWVMPLRTMNFIDFNASDPLPYPPLGELGVMYLEQNMTQNHAGLGEIVQSTARILIQEEKFDEARYWMDRYLDLYPHLTEKELWVFQSYYIQALRGQKGWPLAKYRGADYPFGIRVEGQHRKCVIKPPKPKKMANPSPRS